MTGSYPDHITGATTGHGINLVAADAIAAGVTGVEILKKIMIPVIPVNAIVQRSNPQG
jgi:hypothetical protein